MWRPETEGGQEGRGEGGSLTVKPDKLPLAVAWVSEHTPSHSAVITLIPSLPLPELSVTQTGAAKGPCLLNLVSHTLPCPTAGPQLGSKAASTCQALSPSVSPESGSSGVGAGVAWGT